MKIKSLLFFTGLLCSAQLSFADIQGESFIDFETGSTGDLLTSTMAANCTHRNIGTWEIREGAAGGGETLVSSSTHLFISTNGAHPIYTPVYVGTTTYSAAGTRGIWADWSSNSQVRLQLPGRWYPNLSVGFFFRYRATVPLTTSTHDLVNLKDSGRGVYAVLQMTSSYGRAYLPAGNTPIIHFHSNQMSTFTYNGYNFTGGWGVPVEVVPDHWYWITMNFAPPGSRAQFNVYDAENSYSLVGISWGDIVPGSYSDFAVNQVWFGSFKYSFDDPSQGCYYDNIVISTSGVFPLGPGGGGIPSTPAEIDADDANIQYSGRVNFTDPKNPKFDWPGVSIKTVFQGTSLGLKMEHVSNNVSYSTYNYYNVFIDNQPAYVFCLTTQTVYTVAQGLADTSHEVLITKRTEPITGKCVFKGFVLDAGKTLQAPAPKPGRKLEFLGDSFTCGWDNEGVGAAPEQSYYPYMKENNYLTYGPMVGRYFNAECSILAWSGTSIATPATARLFEGYDQTLAYETTKNWSFSSWVPDATIIYLGMNDGGIAQQQFETAYSSFIARIRAKRPDTELICLWWRPWGNDPIGTYVTNVVSSKTAAGDTKIHAALLDFSWVAADLAQGHPTVSGNQKIADNLVPVIQGILGWSTDTSSPSAPGIVRDGATAGIDISSTVSTTQLSANWTVGADAESGISGYLYAVGTTAGGTNTKSWTTIGNVLSTTTALNLTLGTTYYFSVKSINGVGLVSATAANSNGQFVVAVSTAVVDTSSPTAPGIVRDGAATGVDISSTMSNGTLSANWTAGSDPESAVTGYRYAIGTTAGGTNTAGWAALGNVLSVTRNGLTLATGATYYFTVKAVNSIGLVSISAANSNGQYIVAIDTSDVTAPSNISVVRDGLSSDVDSSTSLTQLSANWDASADAESGIARYWYAIGTQTSGPGITNVQGWTDNGQSISVTATGLALTQNVTYYISVKAENNVGLESAAAATSNGQVVLVSVPADTTPPVISLVSAQSITATGVTIIWTTNEPSSSLVEYGKLVNYDKVTALDSTLNTAHSMTIANLTAGTAYHFRVISADASNNETTSADYTFTTLAAAISIPESVRAYPNPCRISEANPARFRSGGENISKVAIYTVSGRLIKELSPIGASSAEITWDGTNTDGEKLRRGIYIYKITSSDGSSSTGKIVLTK